MDKKESAAHVAIMLAIITLGCGFLTPTNMDTQINTTPEYGGFMGDDPEIYFYIEDGGVFDFKISIPAVTEENQSFSCVIYENSIRPGYENSITLAPDGSFTYGETPDPNNQFGFYITGKVEGKTAHGNYIINVCDPMYSSSNPFHSNRFEGEWNANWFEPTPIPPTRTPYPTPIPPVAGHFKGMNPFVSFDITESGVITHFNITVSSCTLRQSGTWQLNERGSFSAIGNSGTSTIGTGISGHIEEKTATGGYQISMCDSTVLNNTLVGNWSANWVSP